MSWTDDVEAGGCRAWSLPLDTTCASVARRLFRDAAMALGLSEERIYDGVTMASELAANTLHAHDNIEFDSSRQRPIVGFPELWLYVRGPRGCRELVCKVFDSKRSWKSGAPPDTARLDTTVSADAIGFAAAPVPADFDPPQPVPELDPAVPEFDAARGRGLRLVAALSGGRWGHHLTRARLGRWKVPGKAVWFAVPLPDTPFTDGHLHDTCDGPQTFLTARQAAKELETMLADRGLGQRLVRCDEPVADLSVLSVSHGLTVWCRRGRASWRAGSSGGYASLPLWDLVEIAEQVVRVHEELAAGAIGSADERGDRTRQPG